MRELIDAGRARSFMREIGRRLKTETSIYFTGGVSAVLEGWRGTTMDLDVKLEPDEEAFGLISDIKRDLNANIELASPDLFIPALPGWKERSRFIAREGRATFFHYDFYAQALAKIERGFERDLGDVDAMVKRGLVDPDRGIELFEAVEPDLIRFPAIDPASFKNAVLATFGSKTAE